MDKITICNECFEQFKKWLLLQAYRNSYPSHTKMRQTKAYMLYEVLESKKDITIKK
jgi:hypothetical protein